MNPIAFHLPAGRTLAFAALLAAMAGTAHATTYTWQGGAANNNFNQASNWTNDAAPASDLDNTDLLFNASNGHPYPSAQTAYNLHSLTFSTSADSYDLAGSTLTIGSGGILQDSASAENISNAVSLGASQAWSFGAAGTLTLSNGLNTNGYTLTLGAGYDITATLSANINGSGSVVANGGTVILSGTNTYTGYTELAAGTLSLGSAGALNGTSVLFFAGGTLQYTAANTTDDSGRFSTAAGQTYASAACSPTTDARRVRSTSTWAAWSGARGRSARST